MHCSYDTRYVPRSIETRSTNVMVICQSRSAVGWWFENMEPGTLTKVLNDFLTTVEGELSLCKGEYFLVHKIIDKHWCYGEAQGKIGKFPLDHLYKADVPLLKGKDKLFIGRASFPGQMSGDLIFDQGEIVIGEAEVGGGWYYGRRTDGKDGIFPSTHVWEPNPEILKKASAVKTIHKQARVTASLQAQLAGEMDITTGEIITVLEIFEDGWCRGRKEDGTQGIFPEAFISYINDDHDELDRPSTGEFESIDSEEMSSSADVFSDCLNYDETTDANESAPNYYDLFPEHVAANPENSEPYAITLYAFDAQFPNELSFQAGEIVSLNKYVDSEWLDGTKNGVRGIFPVSYVNIIIDCPRNEEAVPQNESNNIPDIVEDTVQTESHETIVTSDIDIDLNTPKTKSETENADVGERLEESVNESCKTSDSFEDFVMIRTNEVQVDNTRRISVPHRPAPPVPKLLQQKLYSNEAKFKESDQRQNVISELVLTEKEYVRDLKLTYEVFHLHDPHFLESKGVDVAILFGNIFDVILIAEELLDMILKSMKNHDEEVQMIGPCFIKMAEKLQLVYVKYCGNHEAALMLLKKYETNDEILAIFNKGIETLRYQIACFDMSSILIKPVQRILKYPLILRELVKCTDSNHPDRPLVEEAYKVMGKVASYINESKRRKDLVSKYLENENTLRRKIANLNMHSVAKMSTRLSTKLSASLGLTNIAVDPEFDELERQFRAVEKCTWQLGKDVEQCLAYLSSEAVFGEVIADSLIQYYQGIPNVEVQKLQNIRQAIRSLLIQDLKSCLERRVSIPVQTLGTLLEGPAVLITKRHDKMLDYDAAISKSEKYKDSRLVQEELLTAKVNFEALSQQLLEELPVLIDAATKILAQCVSAFAHARKFLCGRVTKRYLSLCENPLQVSSQDILESFLVNHNLLWNQLTRFTFAGSSPALEHEQQACSQQSKTQIVLLKGKYPNGKLYLVTQNVGITSSLDIGAVKGTLVAVVKHQDPMGNASRWFVDNGISKGFLPASALTLLPDQPEIPRITEEAIDGSQSTNMSSLIEATDLMSLDSPVKEQSSMSHLEELISLNLDSGPKKEEEYNNTSQAKNLQHFDPHNEFYYAVFDFHGNIPGTLSVTQGRVLRVLKPHDEKGNNEWWLVEDRDRQKGYVPQNYLKQLSQ